MTDDDWNMTAAKIPAAQLEGMCHKYLAALAAESEQLKSAWVIGWLNHHSKPSWLARLFGCKPGTPDEAEQAYCESDTAVFHRLRTRDQVDAVGLLKLCKIAQLNDPTTGFVYVGAGVARRLYEYMDLPSK